MIINPDSMFESIKERARASGKALWIEKRILNSQSFNAILAEGPKLLFIMCHGNLIGG